MIMLIAKIIYCWWQMDERVWQIGRMIMTGI